MEVNFLRDLPIKAEPIDEHYRLEKDRFDVQEINMGQTNTSIKLLGFDNVFNSIHFKFYLHNTEIDIYRSGLLNPYRSLKLPMIYFKESED